MKEVKCYTREFVLNHDPNALVTGMNEYSSRITDVVAMVPGTDVPLLLCAMMNVQAVIEQVQPGATKAAEVLRRGTGCSATVLTVPIKQGDDNE